MEELERGDKNSKSLLANVLDMDDDFIASVAAEKIVNMCQPQPHIWNDYESLNGYMMGSPRSPNLRYHTCLREEVEIKHFIFMYFYVPETRFNKIVRSVFLFIKSSSGD